MFLIERFRRTREPVSSLEYYELWQDGNIFHEFRRMAISPDGKIVDRLMLILENGLIPPLTDNTGTVIGNWPNIQVTSSVPYNSVVFMHRVDSYSKIYRPYPKEDRGKLYLFIDKNYPVLVPFDMGLDWPILTIGDDEVYSKDVISPYNFKAVVASIQEASKIAKEAGSQLRELDIPLYDFSGIRLI